ncbi:putative testis-expressed protein 13C [Drosophila innubila]|uniref:putative testis-expressed protein 13C n=1 Tax=Drosophila innubila TaxID=198719 RepID=UPI00148CB43E|nr:putative testis-expressed protein 13C [Drosophila innubila]
MQFYVIALAVIGVVAADVSHLQLGSAAGYSYSSPSSPSSSAQFAIPGGDSSSYQPEHLIPQHLKSASASQSFNLGADTQTPEQFIPEADRIAHTQYVQEQAQAQVVVPGGDSSSYQPAHLIPQHLKASHVSTTQSINLGADTQTPEQFIPEADRIAHTQYVQEQAQAQVVVPGGDSSSYQPEHLIPQHLQAAHVESASAQLVPGGDSSSYQPAHLIPQHLKASYVSTTQSINLGADTQTPEQFIPEADRIAHYNYVQAQTQASAQIIPGGDSSSYQPEHLIPQHLQSASASESFNLGADTQTPEQFIPEADRIAHANYVQEQEQHQSQSPVVIGANTITPAHLYQEQVSNGIEEFNPETHVPVVIGRDTVTPAHLLPKYSVGATSSASSSIVSSGHDTQYGSNGGYVY